MAPFGESAWQPAGLEILHDRDFTGTRLNRLGIYVVCFAASWCPITRRFIPKFLEARNRFPGTLAIADITDLDSALWDTFEVRITPSIIVFRDGDVLARLGGKRFVGISDSSLVHLEETLAATAR